MDYQALKLARKMQLEESLEFQRNIFKADVIAFNTQRDQITELKMEHNILSEKINKVKDNIKNLEMDINLLNKEITKDPELLEFPKEKV